jgi:uncharacterized membrane-anchored protein
MNKTMFGPRGLTLLGALLVLGALNFAIFGKERIKSGGELAYLPLAPVDPRSLMQGDYMALRFTLVQALEQGLNGDGAARAAREGEVRWADVVLAADHVATLAEPGSPAAPRFRFRFRIRNGHVWLGTNAFFFQEGDAARFAAARFGEFRVDRSSGEAVLVGLRDANLKAL